MPNKTTVAQVEIADRNGEYAVLLDRHSDDHIVTRFMLTPNGELSITLGHGTWPWARAVRRATRALAFVT